MIEFPITDLFDDSLCLLWLERHLHPDGFVCPQCGSANRRRFRTQGYYDAYRCRASDGYYTLLRGTAFEGSRQRPATLVLLLCGITKGESTARLARELDIALRKAWERGGAHLAPLWWRFGETLYTCAKRHRQSGECLALHVRFRS